METISTSAPGFPLDPLPLCPSPGLADLLDQMALSNNNVLPSLLRAMKSGIENSGRNMFFSQEDHVQIK